ncbi:MAG: redoxin family protein [Planctomycetota bacterium]
MASSTAAEDAVSGTFEVRAVDADGKPVAGAVVTTFVSWSQPPFYESLDGAEALRTDRDGRASVSAEALFRYGRIAVPLVVWDEAGRRLAVAKFTPETATGQRDLTLEPACRMTGHITSAALEELGAAITWTNTYVYLDGLRPMSAESSDGQIELFLPPGKYRLVSYGTNIYGKTLHTEIATGETAKHFDLDLPAHRLMHLYGQPAPELRQIKGWKNGGPVALEQLRGKVVLLDFWGVWCGPCLNGMPKLMEWHEKYADDGLVIIAVHDDSVEKIEEMDAKLRRARQQLWNGRDLPFLVALDGGGQTEVPGTDGRAERGATTAFYGIDAWPTTLLINRDGVLVEEFHPGSEDAEAKLRRHLGIGEDAVRKTAWREAFDAVYRLDEDEVVKRVAPPFIPERLTYYQSEHAGQARRIAEPPDRFVFHVQPDGSVKRGGLSFGGADTLRHVLGWLGLKRYELDGDAALLDAPVLPGDWVIRDDATIAAKLTAMESVAAEAGLAVAFELRHVERDVVVAAGVLRRPQKTVKVSAVDPENDDESGGGSGDGKRFLAALGSQLGVYIDPAGVVDLDQPLSWSWYRSSRLRAVPEGKRDAMTRAVLDRVTAQTGLHFEMVRREVPVWHAVRVEQAR